MLNAQYLTINKYLKKRFILLIVLWLASLLLLSILSYRRIIVETKNDLGNKAMLLAISTTESLNVEQKDIDRLLSLNFNDLLKDSINIDFEKKTRAVMNRSNIKYIYLLTPLEENQIKYRVEKGEEQLYKAPVGTPLDVVYVLDAVVSDEERLKDSSITGLSDKDRYNIAGSEYEKMFQDKQPAYKISKDRWGDFISGYAPYFDKDGNFLGLIGVDILLDKYIYSVRKYSLNIVGFIILNIALGILTTLLALTVRKSDELIYEKSVLSCTDELTLLLNRRGFLEIFERELKASYLEKKYISLLLIDIDYFKEYNDSFGHLAGDNALEKIAYILDNKSKQYGGFAGRYGGDEFMVLLPNTSEGKAKRIAELILKDIESIKYETNHKKMPFLDFKCNTVSVGVVSLIPNEKSTTEMIIDYADTALYKSKRYGRNRVYVWRERKVSEAFED